MERKTLFAVIFGMFLIATLFAAQARAFFWLGGCARCTYVPPLPPVIDPNAIRIGTNCGELIVSGTLTKGDCISQCNWRFEDDMPSAKVCKGQF